MQSAYGPEAGGFFPAEIGQTSSEWWVSLRNDYLPMLSVTPPTEIVVSTLPFRELEHQGDHRRDFQRDIREHVVAEMQLDLPSPNVLRDTEVPFAALLTHRTTDNASSESYYLYRDFVVNRILHAITSEYPYRETSSVVHSITSKNQPLITLPNNLRQNESWRLFGSLIGVMDCEGADIFADVFGDSINFLTSDVFARDDVGNRVLEVAKKYGLDILAESFFETNEEQKKQAAGFVAHKGLLSYGTDGYFDLRQLLLPTLDIVKTTSVPKFAATNLTARAHQLQQHAMRIYQRSTNIPYNLAARLIYQTWGVKRLGEAIRRNTKTHEQAASFTAVLFQAFPINSALHRSLHPDNPQDFLSVETVKSIADTIDAIAPSVLEEVPTISLRSRIFEEQVRAALLWIGNQEQKPITEGRTVKSTRNIDTVTDAINLSRGNKVVRERLLADLSPHASHSLAIAERLKTASLIERQRIIYEELHQAI